jgi:hypothetical protein
MLDGPNERGTNDRATNGSTTEVLGRNIGNFTRGLREDSDTTPTGTAITIARDFSVNVPTSLQIRYLFLKPAFVGEIAIQFGSSNPELEVIRRSGQFDVEINRQVNELVQRNTTIEIQDRQLGILASVGANLLICPPAAYVQAIRTVLATRIVDTYNINNWGVETIMPPILTTSRLYASVALIFMRIIGTWSEKVYETTLFGVPARIILTGEIEFKVGLKAFGWDWIGRFLIQHCGTLGAAAQMEIMSAQLAVSGAVNGILGIASPALVATGTPLTTFLIDYAWANLIADIRDRGIRRGLLNQFASGYIRRIFYPRQSSLWYANHPQGRAREARQQGIQIGARDVQRSSSIEILQAMIYTELDYNRQSQAQVSDLIFRLGEALFRGQRTMQNPQQRTDAPPPDRY